MNTRSDLTINTEDNGFEHYMLSVTFHRKHLAAVRRTIASHVKGRLRIEPLDAEFRRISLTSPKYPASQLRSLGSSFIHIFHS